MTNLSDLYGTGALHGTTHTNGTDDIQSATAAQKGLATAAQITKLDGIEALADVTSTHETSHADVLVDGDIGVAVMAYDAQVTFHEILTWSTL